MNIQYPSLLINLDTFKAMRGIGTQTDDSNIKRCIKQASSWFENEAQRSFVPYRQTRTYDALGSHIAGNRLRVDEDLLEVVTLTNGDGEAIAVSGIALRPKNITPKYEIELKASAGAAWGYTEDYQDAIAIDGYWGFHQNYSQAWKAVDTLVGSLTTGATLAVVGDAAGVDEWGFAPRIGTLDYIRVDNEMMLVTAITGNTLTITRAANGTTAGTHAAATDVSGYRQAADITRAVTFLTGYYYDVKDTSGNGIQILDFAMKVDRTIADEILETKERYQRKEIDVL